MKIRLTKNSIECLKIAEKIWIEQQGSGADRYFVILCRRGLWSVMLHNSQGPVVFFDVNDAVKFLRSRKIPVARVTFESAI